MSLPECIAEEREKDRFWFGERFVKRIGDDGEITYAAEPVPLRPEDLLFPRQGIGAGLGNLTTRIETISGTPCKSSTNLRPTR